MTDGRGAQAYTQTQVSTTTNQQQLIVMAYDGILRFLNQSKDHLAKGEIEGKYTALYKARAVLEELAATLNVAAGGEVARNLWNLYMFFMQKIGEASLTNDPTHVDDILPAIKDLRDAWAEMKIADDDAQAQNLNRRVPAPSDAQRVSVMG